MRVLQLQRISVYMASLNEQPCIFKDNCKVMCWLAEFLFTNDALFVLFIGSVKQIFSA